MAIFNITNRSGIEPSIPFKASDDFIQAGTTNLRIGSLEYKISEI